MSKRRSISWEEWQEYASYNRKDFEKLPKCHCRFDETWEKINARYSGEEK